MVHKRKIENLKGSTEVHVIGEIGINHNGSLKTAKQLIDLAAMVGIDSVKFQKRTPEICVPEHQRDRMRDTPWGTMTYFDYKKRIEFGQEEFEEIDRYCREKGMSWSASAWDLPSLEFLEQFDLPYHKVASAKLTDRALLEALRQTGKPVILSVGMTDEDDLKKAVALFPKDYPLAILHCNSEYPTPHENMNLLYIKRLQQLYPHIVIGHSGHELGIAGSKYAVSLGAQIIERHITLDRSMWGTDQSASLEYVSLRPLVRDIRLFQVMLGDGNKVVTDVEKKMRDKLRDVHTL